MLATHTHTHTHTHTQGGEYELSLLVGDPEAAASVQWALGPLDLVLPAAGEQPLTVRTAATQPVSFTKPVITHIFVSASVCVCVCVCTHACVCVCAHMHESVCS